MTLEFEGNIRAEREAQRNLAIDRYGEDLGPLYDEAIHESFGTKQYEQSRDALLTGIGTIISDPNSQYTSHFAVRATKALADFLRFEARIIASNAARNAVPSRIR